MAKIYGEKLSPISTLLTRTGQLVVIAATVDQQMKDDDQDAKEKSPPYQIFDIENQVEQSEHSVQYLVFNCANEEERDKFSKCIAVNNIYGEPINYRYESEF